MTVRSMTGDRQRPGRGLMFSDHSDVDLSRLLVDSSRDSAPASSAARESPTAADQTRFLLLAVFGAWAGFLGLMAVVATDGAVSRVLGAITLIVGVGIVVAGLSRVVGDRPARLPDRGPLIPRP